VLATGNPGKVEELQLLLQDIPIAVTTASALGLALPPDEPYPTFLENATHKALFVAGQTTHLVLGEDSGLEVDALDGRPGVLSKRFSGPDGDAAANNTKLLECLAGTPKANRQARFRCTLALAEGDKVLFTASGTCEGLITDQPRGAGGFGYDPVFLLPELGQTMAELSKETKNCISHRFRALEKAIPFIRQYAVGTEAASQEERARQTNRK
jgi:XTP/dITP diphosphohydrolase